MQRVIRIPGKSVTELVKSNAELIYPVKKKVVLKDVEVIENTDRVQRYDTLLTNPERLLDSLYNHLEGSREIVLEVLSGYYTNRPEVLGYQIIDQRDIRIDRSGMHISVDEVDIVRAGRVDVVAIVVNGDIFFTYDQPHYDLEPGAKMRFSQGLTITLD